MEDSRKDKTKYLLILLLIFVSIKANSSPEKFDSSLLNLTSIVGTDNQNYVFLRDNTGKRYVVNQQDYFKHQGVGYKLQKVSENDIYLVNEYGVIIHIVKKDQQDNKDLSGSQVSKKFRNINLRIPEAENVSLAKIKLISKLTEFSPNIANILKPYEISFKRNFAGRPGVLISDYASNLQAIGIALEEDDIVLSVNGVPANELEELTEILMSGEKIYFVEYERNNKLAMMKVEFK